MLDLGIVSIKQVNVRSSSFLDHTILFAALLFINAFILFKWGGKEGKMYTSRSSEFSVLCSDNCYQLEALVHTRLESM